MTVCSSLTPCARWSPPPSAPPPTGSSAPRPRCDITSSHSVFLSLICNSLFQVQQCSTVVQQECRTVDEGYYQTKCTTTTVTRVPVAPSTTTVTQGQTQTTQGGDNCQYKWEGKGDNMR